ncbi:MAG: ferrous iron transport protein B [Rhodospirillaceae bacterium]
MEHRNNPITAMLVGNPNSGKTALYNQLTGDHALIANYPRVTVSQRSCKANHNGTSLRVIDLHGIYTLNGDLPEERVGRDAIHYDHPDVVINVLDAGNLHRSLFLTMQLVEMGRPCVFVLNMIDEARSRGITIDTRALAEALGGPVIETVATTGHGISDLVEAIKTTERRHGWVVPDVHYGDELEANIRRIQAIIVDLHPAALESGESRWLAIKLLEGDSDILEREGDHETLITEVRTACAELENHHGEECAMMIAHARFLFIEELLKKIRHESSTPSTSSKWLNVIDDLLLHRHLGLPIFCILLWTMFQSTFTFGAIPASAIGAAAQWATNHLDSLIPPGQFHDLMINGVMAGVSGTIVFLPNIVILFLFMALFNETGYLARVAFLLDRLMRAFGLHGKALIPLIMGFGCNAAAVMATRSIEAPRARLIAILVAPYVSCSARLPIFILFAGAFFDDWAGSVVFALYILSVLVSLGAAVLFDRTLAAGDEECFVMELPPYRKPQLASLLWQIWDSAQDYLRKIGGVIVIGSIAIWFLQQFPVAALDMPPEHKLAASYLGKIAAIVHPAFTPLGFGLNDTIAIMTGLIAKETVVSSYAVLNAQDKGSAALRQAIAGSMTPTVAIAFMVFVLLYTPCLTTLAVIQRESGSWRWVGVSLGCSLIFAWGAAFVVSIFGGFLV